MQFLQHLVLSIYYLLSLLIGHIESLNELGACKLQDVKFSLIDANAHGPQIETL